MLVSKYDIEKETEEDAFAYTSVPDTMLNLLSNNYVVIDDVGCFDEETLFAVAETGRQE